MSLSGSLQVIKLEKSSAGQQLATWLIISNTTTYCSGSLQGTQNMSCSHQITFLKKLVCVPDDGDSWSYNNNLKNDPKGTLEQPEFILIIVKRELASTSEP